MIPSQPLSSYLLPVGSIAGGGDVAGGGFVAAMDSRTPGCSVDQDESIDMLVTQELQPDQLNSCLEEKRRSLPATPHYKGLIQIMARVRPPLEGEDDDVGCLRVLSKEQLEVMTEPRALLTDQHVRNRRRTTGGIDNRLRSKSASVLSEAADMDKAKEEPRVFQFDKLFDYDASDDDVFAALQDEIAAAVNGEAVCILAYGATGSGKTYTVQNLAARAAQDLERQAIALADEGVRLDITVQIVEIYNEQLRDLLAQDGNAEPPKLRLTVSCSSPNLQGATLRTITAETGCGIARGLQDALRIGQAQRATSSTSVHGRSSRSHLVMTLFLTSRDKVTGVLQRSGKLSLVDLAGSERLKRSEAVGERLREAQHINRSLSALADVISAKERRVAFVPYRNSKLTHLLQDALGGVQQCRTTVIVALPPTRFNLGETMHSLQFSSRLTALSLPTVSRRSLSTFDQGRLNRFRGSRDDLTSIAEMERLRLENVKLSETLTDFRTQIAEKDRLLEQARKEAEDLRASTEVFERSRTKLFQGFEVLHRCLEEVEEVTFTDSEECSTSAGLFNVTSDNQLDLDGILASEAPSFELSYLSRNASSSAGALPEAPLFSRRGSPPPRTASRSGSGILQVKRMQPVLRTSRSAGMETSPLSARPGINTPMHNQSRTGPLPYSGVSSAAPSSQPSGRRDVSARRRQEAVEKRSASPPNERPSRVGGGGHSSMAKSSSPPARVNRNASPGNRRLRTGQEGAASAGGLPKASSAQASRQTSPELRRLRVGTTQGNNSSASRLPKAFPVAAPNGRNTSPDVPSRRARGATVPVGESGGSRPTSPELPPRSSRPRSKDAPREVPTPARNRQAIQLGAPDVQQALGVTSGGDRSTGSTNRIPLGPRRINPAAMQQAQSASPAKNARGQTPRDWPMPTVGASSPPVVETQKGTQSPQRGVRVMPAVDDVLSSSDDSDSDVDMPSSYVGEQTSARGQSPPAHFEMFSPRRGREVEVAESQPVPRQPAHNADKWSSPRPSPQSSPSSPPRTPAWLDHASSRPAAVYKAPPVPVVPMTPRASDLLDGIGGEGSPQGSPGLDGEAPTQTAPPLTARRPVSASAAMRSPRSNSASRRGGTPREYVVEVITPALARELAPDVPLDDVAQDGVLESPNSLHDPQSPALLLCTEGADSCEESTNLARSTSSVSISSDEGEIRDRLTLGLQLRSAGEEASPCGPPASSTRGNQVQSPRGNPVLSARGPKPVTSPGRARRAGPPSPNSSPGRYVAAAGQTPPGKENGGQSFLDNDRASVGHSSTPKSRRPRGREINVHPSIAAHNAGASRAGHGGNARRGAPSMPSTVISGGTSPAAFAQRSSVVTPQRQYAPVLSRRSLGIPCPFVAARK